MVKIEGEDLVDEPISKDCTIFISFRIRGKNYNIDFHELVERTLESGMKIEKKESDKVVVSAGNRLWFKRPRLMLTKIRNAIESHLQREQRMSPEDAIKEAVDITGATVYAMSEYNRADLGIEFTLETSPDETATEPIVIKQFLKNTALNDLFEDVEFPQGNKFQLSGLTTKITAEALDRGVEYLRESIDTSNEMLFCRPVQ